LACVRFGMVTADTDVAELLSLVQSTGRKEEESTKYIDSMAELVKKGMKKSNTDNRQIWYSNIFIILFRYRNCDCRLKKRNRRKNMARRHFTTCTSFWEHS